MAPPVRLRERLPGPVTLAIGAATAMLAVATMVLALTYAVYAERAAGDTRRFPDVAAERTAETTSILIVPTSLPDHRPYWLVHVEPDGPGAPLPPGLEDWLGPGEVAASPSLAAALATSPSWPGAGDVAATVGPDGLSAPDELFGYVGGRDLDQVDASMPVSSFGHVPDVSAWQVGSSGALFGESLDIRGLAWLWALQVVLCLIPCLWTTHIAAREVARVRSRRSRLLEILGAPAGWQRMQLVRTVLPAVLLGTAAGSAALLVPTLLAARVPDVDFILSPQLVARHPVALVCAILSAVGLALALVVISPTRGEGGTTRPLTVVQRMSPAWVVAGATSVLLAARLPGWVDPTKGVVWVGVYWSCILLVLFTVPLALAVLVTQVAAAFRPVAARAGDGAAVAALGWLCASPRSLLRGSAVLTMVLGIMFQATVFTHQRSEDLRTALALEQVVQGRVLVVDAFSEVPADELLSVAPGTALVRPEVSSGDSSGGRAWSLTLAGTCPALAAVAIPCEPGQVAVGDLPTQVGALVTYTVPVQIVDVDVVEEMVLDVDRPAWLVGDAQQRLDRPALTRAFANQFGPTVELEQAGESWIVGAQRESDQSRWVPLLAGLGLLASLVSLGIDLRALAGEQSRRAGLLAALVGRESSLWRMAGMVAMLPVLVIGSLTFVVHWIVSAPNVSVVPPAPTPVEVLLPLVVVSLLLGGAFSWWLVGRSSVEASRSWVARDEAVE